MSKVEHDALEDLLLHASPRPVPAPEELVAAKAAVRDEWRAATTRRVHRRRLANLAIAASVIAGIFAVLNVLRVPAVDVVQVATIEKSFGPVYLLGDQAELRPTRDLSDVMSGQTIVTGDGAGLALTWGDGGSLRADENTRVRFTSSEAVFLEDGRVYFDSQSSLIAGIDAGDVPAFTVQTEYGDIRHLGTQYMTDVARDRLVVSVREGKVTVDGTYHDETISSGQQATFTGPQRPSILSISRAGQAWDWIGRTTPAADVDGRSLHEFLVWISREMGLELRFEGHAEAVAQAAILKGTIDTEPANALRLRLATAALEWRIEEGVIYITD